MSQLSLVVEPVVVVLVVVVSVPVVSVVVVVVSVVVVVDVVVEVEVEVELVPLVLPTVVVEWSVVVEGEGVEVVGVWVVVVIGSDEQREVFVVLQAMPEETCAEGHVEYGALAVRGWHLRTITTRPRRGGRAPGWLWIPGIACVSQDFAALPSRPARPLIAALTGAGAVTMRVELPGLGDSKCPDCGRLGFAAQVEVFAAGLQALQASPWVDPSALALLGHSVGGSIAPLLAAEPRVRGVAVYGATARPWTEVVQRAAARAGLQEPPPEVTLAGRAPQFHAELARVDVAAAWSRVQADVAVLHGERDAVAPREDAGALADHVSQRSCAETCHVEIADGEHELVPGPAIAAALLSWARARGLAC